MSSRKAQPFLDAGLLSHGDVNTVELAAPRFGEDDPQRLLGLAFAVRAPREGHAGVDLARLAGRINDERLRQAADAGEDDAALRLKVEDLPWPDPAAWADETFRSPMVGAPDQHGRPFVRQETDDGALLLTRRMYREQELVAKAVRERAAREVPEAARVPQLDEAIARLFPTEPDGESARAVRLAATRRLAVVIGGPGTGKTFSITRLLAALLEARRGATRPLVVKLAAPTGKAAARMREAIREATSPGASPPLEAADDVRDALQRLDSSTLHRLIGLRPDGTARHGRHNPIPADVVVVDEVSMVDLALMRRLLEAVHDEARLVLLGDRDQLASVEAGCVLADLVGNGQDGPLAANVQAFTRSRRFEAAPDIALIAACLQSYETRMPDVPADRHARAGHAVAVFTGHAHASTEKQPKTRVTHLGAPVLDQAGARARPDDAQLADLARPYVEGFETLDPDGKRLVFPGYAGLLMARFAGGRFADDATTPEFHRALLDALEHYRVLAVHRRGPLGVAGLEREISQRVRAFFAGKGHAAAGRHWIGRPILVTENAYDVRLMNGDVGLVLPTPQGVAAVFPHEKPGQVHTVALSRLPPHEGALAMTVHKSQGSQFGRVALVLAGRPSPIQTRELVYTGVTRARHQFAWLGTPAELTDALGRSVERASGLHALLRQPG